MNSPGPDNVPQDSLDSYNGVNDSLNAYPLNDPSILFEAAVLVCVCEALTLENPADGDAFVVHMLTAMAIERPALERMNRYSPELVELFEAMKRGADHERILQPADPEEHALQASANLADLMRLATKVMLPALKRLNEEEWNDDWREWQAQLEELREQMPKDL